jgi:hypothetical protein
MWLEKMAGKVSPTTQFYCLVYLLLPDFGFILKSRSHSLNSTRENLRTRIYIYYRYYQHYIINIIVITIIGI